jgi:hypothetical protein
MSDQRANSRAKSDGQTSTKERSEELVEDWAVRLGQWLRVAVARTREEAEDIWAEAQDLRRRI